MTVTQSTGVSGVPPLSLGLVSSILQPACVLDGVQGYVGILPPAIQVGSGGTVNRYMIIIKFVTLIYAADGSVQNVAYIQQDCARFAESLQAQLTSGGALYTAVLDALNAFLDPVTVASLDFSAVSCGP